MNEIVYTDRGVEPSHRDSLIGREQVVEYFREGYLVVPDVFTSEKIAEVRESLNRISEVAFRESEKNINDYLNGQLFVDHESGAQIVLSTALKNGTVTIKRIVGCGSMDRKLLDVTRDPRILNTVGQLLDVYILDQIICQFHPKHSKDGAFFGLHADIQNRMSFDENWKDVKLNGSYVIAYIVVDDADAENGGLRILPGSNRTHQQDYRMPISISAEDESKMIIPSLTSGSILLMHPQLIHNSSPNESERDRFALLGGYSAVGANHAKYPGGDCVRERLKMSGNSLGFSENLGYN